MSANNLVKPAGYGTNDIVLASELQALQVQGAQAINRTSTFSGSRAQAVVFAGASAEFAFNNVGELVQIATNGEYMMIPLLDLPNGHVLTRVRMWILPVDAVRGGTPPDYLPWLQVFKLQPSLASATPTQLGSALATWGSEAAYEAGQSLDVNGLTETIDLDTYAYFATFRGEADGSSFAGMKISGLDVTVTIDTAYGGADLTHWRRA